MSQSHVPAHWSDVDATIAPFCFYTIQLLWCYKCLHSIAAFEISIHHKLDLKAMSALIEKWNRTGALPTLASSELLQEFEKAQHNFQRCSFTAVKNTGLSHEQHLANLQVILLQGDASLLAATVISAFAPSRGETETMLHNMELALNELERMIRQLQHPNKQEKMDNKLCIQIELRPEFHKAPIQEFRQSQQTLQRLIDAHRKLPSRLQPGAPIENSAPSTPDQVLATYLADHNILLTPDEYRQAHSAFDHFLEFWSQWVQPYQQALITSLCFALTMYVLNRFRQRRNTNNDIIIPPRADGRNFARRNAVALISSLGFSSFLIGARNIHGLQQSIVRISVNMASINAIEGWPLSASDSWLYWIPTLGTNALLEVVNISGRAALLVMNGITALATYSSEVAIGSLFVLVAGGTLALLLAFEWTEFNAIQREALRGGPEMQFIQNDAAREIRRLRPLLAAEDSRPDGNIVRITDLRQEIQRQSEIVAGAAVGPGQMHAAQNMNNIENNNNARLQFVLMIVARIVNPFTALGRQVTEELRAPANNVQQRVNQPVSQMPIVPRRVPALIPRVQQVSRARLRYHDPTSPDRSDSDDSPNQQTEETQE